MELTISTPRLAAARILPRTPRAFYRTAINAFFFVMGMSSPPGPSASRTSRPPCR